MPKNTPYRRGDGKLHITFNEIGQGLNLLVALPNGRMLLIDCGTSNWERNYFEPGEATIDQLWERMLRRILGDVCFLANNQIIDLLILTHSDKDHINQLQDLFQSNMVAYESNPNRFYQPASRIQTLCFSNDFAKYGAFGIPRICSQHAQQTFAFIVNQNAGSPSYTPVAFPGNGWQMGNPQPIPDAGRGVPLPYKSTDRDTRGFVKVMEGTHPSNGAPACNVYILASGVTEYDHMYDNSTEENRGSIVTMIVYGDKKFLFMGDATFNTEKFLLDTYEDRIGNVEVLQIPHHASFQTSSSYPNHPALRETGYPDLDFVGKVNPRYAVVSAAWDSGSSYKLPRWETLQGYTASRQGRLANWPRANTITNSRQINAWQWPSSDDEPSSKRRKQDQSPLALRPMPKAIWCTGTHGAIDFDYGVVNGTVGLLTPDRNRP